MTPKSNWVAYFYKSTNDTSTTPYTEIPILTVAGFSGYGGVTGASGIPTVYIVAPQKTKDYGQETLEDVGGWLTSNGTLRDKFDVELWPFTFIDGSDPDLTDWETLSAWLAGATHLWVRFVAGSRNYPSDSTKVHPVVIDAISESVNKSAGSHNVVLSLRVQGTL